MWLINLFINSFLLEFESFLTIYHNLIVIAFIFISIIFVVALSFLYDRVILMLDQPLNAYYII